MDEARKPFANALQPVSKRPGLRGKNRLRLIERHERIQIAAVDSLDYRSEHFLGRSATRGLKRVRCDLVNLHGHFVSFGRLFGVNRKEVSRGRAALQPLWIVSLSIWLFCGTSQR